MEAKIIERHGLALIGMSCHVTLLDVQNRVTIQLAEKFLSRKSEILNTINPNVMYGLSTDPEHYNPETDQFEYFIGIEVSSVEALPEGMVHREIPKNQYVMFTFKGPSENAGQVHRYLYTQWLKDNNYRLSDLYNIEVYDERFKGPDSEHSLTDLYFPIIENDCDTIEIVTLEEKSFIGIPVTNVFQRFDSERMKEANQLFLDRKNEISGIMNDEEYVCPHYANDILFTYIYCMEVKEIKHIPKGMIGFSVPGQRYIKVRTKDQDPYALSKKYLKEHGLENNTRSLALEVFRFGEEQHFNHADIYIPILD